MWHPLRMLVSALAIGAVLSPGPALAAPPGYQRMFLEFPAPVSSLDAGGQITCPAGTVPWGGGTGFTGGFAGPAQDINTSGPTANGWRARYNNRAPQAVAFRITVICANQPTGYTVTYAAADNPAGTQVSATATCPRRTVLFSGGTLSTSDRTQASLLSAWPIGQRAFAAVMWNGTTANERFFVFAVCGRKPAGYTIVAADGSVSSGPTTVAGGAQCPGSTTIIGGGVRIANPMPSVTLGASLDEPATQWLTEVFNPGPAGVGITNYAICVA